jgi:hypothetical protein
MQFSRKNLFQNFSLQKDSGGLSEKTGPLTGFSGGLSKISRVLPQAQRAFVLSGIVLMMMAVLASCEAITGFFSTSWGSNLERDQERLLPGINVGNALELATDSAGNKKKAGLVAEKIRDALAKTNNPADRATLLKAGLIAANNSSDLATVIMGNISDLKNSQMTLGVFLEKIQSAGDVRANADLISGLLDAGKVTGPANLAGAAQDDLVLAAITLLLADAQSQGKTDPAAQENYVKDFDKNRHNAGALTDKQKKALTLAAAGGSGPFTDILGMLHLL